MVCRLPQQYHFMNEPVLVIDGCLGVVVKEAGTVEVHAAVRGHAAVLRLEGQVAAAVDVDARVIDGVAEQQRRHLDFSLGEAARHATH